MRARNIKAHRRLRQQVWRDYAGAAAPFPLPVPFVGSGAGEARRRLAVAVAEGAVKSPAPTACGWRSSSPPGRVS